jgi:hypothetical protein
VGGAVVVGLVVVVVVVDVVVVDVDVVDVDVVVGGGPHGSHTGTGRVGGVVLPPPRVDGVDVCAAASSGPMVPLAITPGSSAPATTNAATMAVRAMVARGERYRVTEPHSSGRSRGPQCPRHPAARTGPWRHDVVRTREWRRGGDAVPAEPPQDPDSWTDEQWLEFLVDSDGDVATPAPAGPRSTPERGALGTVLGAAMKGLRDALYGPTDDEVVVVAPGREPDDDDTMTLHLDEQDPRRSWVRLADPPEKDVQS